MKSRVHSACAQLADLGVGLAEDPLGRLVEEDEAAALVDHA